LTLAEIQRHIGVPPDGVLGKQTLAALAKALGMGNKTYALADPEAFYTRVRKITGPLDQIQVETINGLLEAAAHWPIGWLAYGLATAWHEARLKPIEEIGRGKGRPYSKPGARMKFIPDAPTYGGQSPYGRGLVQLTWCDNYEWADKAIGAGGKLLQDFSLALRPDFATDILVKGMETGAFTHKKLADYIGERGTHDEFVRARRIINGTDRAEMVAGYADAFQEALTDGGWK
jgi:hypothetical protein